MPLATPVLHSAFYSLAVTALVIAYPHYFVVGGLARRLCHKDAVNVR